MNKMLYITVALMGLPLYGMELVKPAVQPQAAIKTPADVDVDAYLDSVRTGHLHRTIIFLRHFPQCVDINRIALCEAMNHCLRQHVKDIESCDGALEGSYEMFAFLLLMGANPQKNRSVIDALTEYRDCQNEDQIKSYFTVDTWTEKHTLRLRKCAAVLLKIVELAEKKDKQVAQEALKTFGIHHGLCSPVPEGHALVRALVKEAVQAYEAVNPEEEAKKKKEKAIAQKIFNDKRIADRKAKEDAKAAANKDKN